MDEQCLHKVDTSPSYTHIARHIHSRRCDPCLSDSLQGSSEGAATSSGGAYHQSFSAAALKRLDETAAASAVDDDTDDAASDLEDDASAAIDVPFFQFEMGVFLTDHQWCAYLVAFNMGPTSRMSTHANLLPFAFQHHFEHNNPIGMSSSRNWFCEQ